MANSKIIRNGESIRPHFDYPKKNTFDSCKTELLESCRNVLEQIADSQMMQCDVAHAIKEQTRILRRIDKRLAKRIKL